MNVKSIFKKAILLCAILIFPSCQSQEEKVISRFNDLAEQIEKDGKDWNEQDWVDLAKEYEQIYEDAKKCKFSNEQYQELGKASRNISVAIASIGVNGLAKVYAESIKSYSNVFTKTMEEYSNGIAKEIEEYSNEITKEMEEYSNGIAKEMEEYSNEFTEGEEDLDEQNDDENDMLPMVYSNCYDGYLNVRAEPNSKSKILGTLQNGPNGAELLGVEGKWSKVRVNGVVGYIWSADVQSTPTDPVYIKASDVVGTWQGEGGIYLTVKNNGKFEVDVARADFIYGTWHLSRNNLVLKYPDGVVNVLIYKGEEMVDNNGFTYSKI